MKKRDTIFTRNAVEKARLELQDVHDRYLKGKISEKEFEKGLKEADKKAGQFEKDLKKGGV